MALTYNLVYSGRGPPPPAVPPGKLRHMQPAAARWAGQQLHAWCLQLAGKSIRAVQLQLSANSMAALAIRWPADAAMRLAALAKQWGENEGAPVKLCFMLEHRCGAWAGAAAAAAAAQTHV